MARFVYVHPKFASWLQKAMEFVKRNEGPLVIVGGPYILDYLTSNKVPHGCVDSKEEVPAGHHYQRVE